MEPEMKHILLASAAALSLATAASAGTLTPAPVEPMVPAPVAPMPTMHDWTGGYAGVGLSYGQANHNQTTLPDFWPNGRGWGVSGLAGYNWQSGAMVMGVEGHLGTGRIRGTTDVGGVTVNTTLDGMASLRGRIGVAQDRTLLFLTAGAAAGRLNHTAVGVDSETRTLNGAVVGVGFEQALGGVNLRGDLEHYRFSGRDFTTAGLPFDGVRTRANVARLSAVFRF
jgi:outer membrane immunogenic protein